MIIVRVKYRNGVFYGLCILYLYLDLKVINLFYGIFGWVMFWVIVLFGLKCELVFFECLLVVFGKICFLVLIKMFEL